MVTKIHSRSKNQCHNTNNEMKHKFLSSICTKILPMCLRLNYQLLKACKFHKLWYNIADENPWNASLSCYHLSKRKIGILNSMGKPCPGFQDCSQICFPGPALPRSGRPQAHSTFLRVGGVFRGVVSGEIPDKYYIWGCFFKTSRGKSLFGGVFFQEF
jgi:hypothetical protein